MMGVLVDSNRLYGTSPTVPGVQATPRAAPVEAEPFEVIMDLSRLLSRVAHSTPTGIDRVEMAYAQGLLRRIPDRLRFGAFHPAGFYTHLSLASAQNFLNDVTERWTHGAGNESRFQRWHEAIRKSLGIRSAGASRNRERKRIYLHLSPRSFERREAYRAILRREKAKLVCFVHDLIPTEHPHYAALSSAALFERRLATMLELASGFLVNSQVTATSLATAALKTGRRVPIKVAPLGVSRLVRGTGQEAQKPYFVVLSTIEPRKNHLLLLQLWQRFAAILPPADVPELVIVGRRGWDIENICNLLDRCPGLKPFVREEGRLSDTALSDVLSGACALLAPSFVEGYGLPVAEALALGVPVIASDIPAHREVGGDVPDYLDPLDGPLWQDAILDYSRINSPRAAIKRAQLKSWRPQSWDRHIDDALIFLNAINNQDDK
jgi:glycosyltransferase involved in cell wall biosynthesis